jgi:non-heme chloroperoxidase
VINGVARLIAVSAFAVWVSATATADEVRRVSVNGVELAYVEAGQGDPVVLVHGGLQDYRFWNGHLARFAQRFRVIAYSRRNHFPNDVGEDGAPNGAGDIHGEDLAALVLALGLGRVHVVGHSSGAVAALFFAAGHPEMVRALALNEPPAGGLLAGTPDGQAVLRESGARLAPAREAFLSRDLDRAIRLFADGVGGPGTFDRRSEADRRMAMDHALAHLADNLSARPRAPFECDAARRIAAPLLLTGGERSPAFFHRIVDALALCLPRSERITVAGASHTVPGERPEAYGEAVVAFLARH